MKALILGGARSGKSQYAEQQALSQAQLSQDKTCVYLATGTAGDKEMAARIDHHQRRRGSQWLLVEEPINLAQALHNIDSEDNIIVIDCLTLWLSNCLLASEQNNNHDSSEKSINTHVITQQKEAFLDILPSLRSDVFIVSNEVGSGVVPLGKLSRDFVDHSGWLHQALAKLCDTVTLVVAGLPLVLKNQELNKAE